MNSLEMIAVILVVTIFVMLVVANILFFMYLHELRHLQKKFLALRLQNKRQHLYVVKFLRRITDMTQNASVKASFEYLMAELQETEKLDKDTI